MLRRPHDEGEQRHSQGYCLQKDASKDIELLPNGWARFARAVDAAIESGPKHRVVKKAKAKKKAPKRKSPKRK